jgi:hypothetical protein
VQTIERFFVEALTCRNRKRFVQTVKASDRFAALSRNIIDMTNDQRLKIVASIKQLLSLVAENATPKMLTVIAAIIIELSRLEDLLS